VILFAVFAAVTLVALPLYAGMVRGRAYATFGAVVLALALPGALAVHMRVLETFPPIAGAWLDAAFLYGLAAAGTHLAALVRPQLRRRAFRFLVSIPGMVFLAAGFLAGVWLLLLLPVRATLWLAGWDGALAALRWLDLAPFVVAVLSVVTSTRLVPEIVRVSIAGDGPDEVVRVPVERYRRRAPAPLTRRPLRIVQVSDPHLGPWQPVAKLRRRIDELVDHEPDLVVVTGDLLTMEGAATPGALAEALAPLQRATGRAVAILGNHDHEALSEVCGALAANGVRLLVDDEAVIETAVGPVQIVGADYVGRGRREHIQALLARFPRRPEHVRLFLLHDPRGFQYVPKGDVDLTLSGHTHGGQVGLVSAGIDWTVLKRTAWPDHGLFAHGPNRLYVHRGTGFYGFPLRIGVPGEASLLELVVEPA
jgi:predicted MPP superfamily phosphohydrolase